MATESRQGSPVVPVRQPSLSYIDYDAADDYDYEVECRAVSSSATRSPPAKDNSSHTLTTTNETDSECPYDGNSQLGGIRFAVVVKKHLIPSYTSYSENERNSCWYSRQENEKLTMKWEKIVARIEAGKPEKKTRPYRGLVCRTEKGSDAINAVIDSLIGAVMDEQDEQWARGVYDDERIAQVSQKLSAGSVAKALIIGHTDEIEALAIRNSSFCDINDDDSSVGMASLVAKKRREQRKEKSKEKKANAGKRRRKRTEDKKEEAQQQREVYKIVPANNASRTGCDPPGTRCDPPGEVVTDMRMREDAQIPLNTKRRSSESEKSPSLSSSSSSSSSPPKPKKESSSSSKSQEETKPMTLLEKKLARPEKSPSRRSSKSSDRSTSSTKSKSSKKSKSERSLSGGSSSKPRSDRSLSGKSKSDRSVSSKSKSERSESSSPSKKSKSERSLLSSSSSSGKSKSVKSSSSDRSLLARAQ